MLQFHRTCFILTFTFLYEYARGRSALNGRVTFPRLAYPVFPLSVSRATGSCTRMFLFLFHVFLLLVQMWTVDSSPVTCLFPLSPFVLSTRLCLPLLLMPFLL